MAKTLRATLSFLLVLAATGAMSAVAPASARAPGDTAAGASDQACTPRIVDGWLRSPPMPMPMLAGFAKIENPCGEGISITGARSDAFGSVELHETTIVDGVSRMREVPELRIAANGDAELRPGGLHLMLMRPVAPLAVGDRARVEFTLADGRRIGADFEVRAANAR